jgi:Na+:H+ antiporter
MLSLFQTVAVLLTLTAAFGWFNAKVLRLPNSIGLLLMSLVASLVLVAVEIIYPAAEIFHTLSDAIRDINFSDTLLKSMLAFLLFAGALHVDLSVLRDRAPIVGLMATVGVIISTLVVATLFWFVSRWAGLPVPFAWALVFGALISPTDPIAVISTLKQVHVPETLEMDMTGESLFNDGVGVVLFTILLAAALSGGASGHAFGPADVIELFVVEALGGAVLGLVTGYIAYRATRMIDEYAIEVLITLALVTGTYALGGVLHFSGPIAVVVAGLVIGNHGAAHGMSEITRQYVFQFWDLIDQMLNSLLFLLIGLEVLVLTFDPALAPLAALAIPIVLFGRFCAVAMPVAALRWWKPFARGTIPVLTWGGVRGGISVALVLSIPQAVAHRPVLLAATYTVAIFTIVVQGLTLSHIIRLAGAGPAQADLPLPPSAAHNE